MTAQDRMDPALTGVVWTRTAKEPRRQRPALAGDLYGAAHARRRMAELFPALAERPGGIAIETYWEGWCAVTESFLPRLQILAPHVYSVGGFSTRGVALAQNVGRLVGEVLAETRGLDDVPLATTDGVHRIRWQPVRSAAARVVFPVYQGMDRIGMS